MSKIFEALQRAQQQSGPGGDPKGVAVENSVESADRRGEGAMEASVPVSPSSVDTPAIWQTAPSIPPAPQGMFFSDPAAVAPPLPAANDSSYYTSGFNNPSFGAPALNSPAFSAPPFGTAGAPPFPGSAPFSSGSYPAAA